MILVSRWKIDTAVDLIERYNCTFTVAPTPFLIDMVSFAEKNGNERVKSLKFFPSAGAPVPRTLVRRGLRCFARVSGLVLFWNVGSGRGNGLPVGR